MEPAIDSFEQARPRLFGLAYRLLGSRMDAEDVLQEAWIRWREAQGDAIRDPEAWLVTVVTRLGIDRQRQLRARREDYIGPWLPEPLLGLAPGADTLAEQASDLSLAFLLALERLGAEERAAFLLHEVFGYAHGEIATMFGRTTPAVRQVVSRARRRIRDERPRFVVSEALHRRVVQRFIDALARDDRDAFVALLADDITWIADGGGKAQAATRVVRGLRAATRLAAGLMRRWRGELAVEPVLINGRTGILLRVAGRVTAVMDLETDGEQVRRIHSVVNPDKLGGLTSPLH